MGINFYNKKPYYLAANDSPDIQLFHPDASFNWVK